MELKNKIGAIIFFIIISVLVTVIWVTNTRMNEYQSIVHTSVSESYQQVLLYLLEMEDYTNQLLNEKKELQVPDTVFYSNFSKQTDNYLWNFSRNYEGLTGDSVKVEDLSEFIMSFYITYRSMDEQADLDMYSNEKLSSNFKDRNKILHLLVKEIEKEHDVKHWSENYDVNKMSRLITKLNKIVDQNPI
ncbi:hypothetical protein [Aquibacillus sediminis]|uniref:hypothetical protein n=1 Tax=Aquibacillus sediminis TaxID=2574734 RepID=UPI0011081F8D|nr:hypothetical protein [Aquibacillus sediminis]